jgi:hypothetical protein
MTGHARGRSRVDEATGTPRASDTGSTHQRAHRDPARGLEGCRRILVLGRTGSGKTTLARELAASLGVTHVELDALYFGPNFSTVALPVLRERTIAALAEDRWVTDGNKSAVRDLVWPRADTVIWLDYPLIVSLWRLAKRAVRRTASLTAEAGESRGSVDRPSVPAQLVSAARGVLRALRSHRGQRTAYPKMFAEPQNQHLAVLRLRTSRATRAWLARITAA